MKSFGKPWANYKLLIPFVANPSATLSLTLSNHESNQLIQGYLI